MKPIGKSISRIVAVQVLYQLEFNTDIKMSTLLSGIKEEINMDKKVFCKKYKLNSFPDKNFIIKLVEGTENKKEELIEVIKLSLSNDIQYEKLNFVLQFILLLATYELQKTETPFKVVIDEYLNVATRFCNNTELTLVNGVLDKIANSNCSVL